MQAHEDPELRRVLKEHAEYFVAPSDLRAEVLASVRSAQRVVSSRRMGKTQRLGAWLTHPLPRLGASFIAGIFATLLGVQIFSGAAGDDATVAALLSDHTRALMTNTTIEVASSNSHTVKPWLSAKLGYSPTVVDLAAQGFPLVGGRRGFLWNVPVAVMVYAYREHEIDLYALPGDATARVGNRVTGRHGYHIRTWEEGGMRYIAVSDVAIERLDEFARRIHEQQASTSE